jgi:hypothetical protein
VWYLREKVTPLTVRDEYGKYMLRIAAAEKGDTAPVKGPISEDI